MRACRRRRLRTELVRAAVRSRQGIAAARAQARLRGCRRKAAGVDGAAGTARLSGPRPPAGGFQRMAVGRFGLPARIRFRRFQTDFAGRAEGPAENPAGRGLCGVLLSGRERPVAFPVCARGESSWKPECGNARLQKRQLAVAPENGAKKSVCAMGSERRRAPCHTGLFCAAWAAIRAVARGVRRRKAVFGRKTSTFLKKGKYLSVFS